MAFLKRQRHCLRDLRSEAAYTLTELLTVLVILGIVVAGLSGLFVSASNAEVEMNRRFRAQLEARLALDKIRRETHCASVVAPTGPSTTVTLTLPPGCPTGTGTVTWCTRSSANGFALFRVSPGLGLCAGGTQWADYLTSANVFDYTPSAVGSGTLARLRVDLPVDVVPASTAGSYRLVDQIVLRNSVRY